MVAAVANLKMWQSLGFMAQFIVGAAVKSLPVRLISLTVVFVAAFGALVVLEKRVASASGSEAPSEPCPEVDTSAARASGTTNEVKA
mmetsp:Transcript_177801/g.564225  ORF Transcript_177801/g.564225 Transcript_177801/m.564225 type:complete len:87 (+) Transcript_177801:1377-1637(+)